MLQQGSAAKVCGLRVRTSLEHGVKDSNHVHLAAGAAGRAQVDSITVVTVEVVQWVVASFSHNAVELVRVDQPVPVAVSLVDHLLQFIIRQSFADFLGDPLQVAEADFPRAVLVEEAEDLV